MTAAFTVLTWTFRLIFAALLILCGLAALAVLAAIACAIGGWQRARQVIDDARRDVAIPGPGTAQASRWPDEDTGIRGWSDAEMAYLKGETDVMPS